MSSTVWAVAVFSLVFLVDSRCPISSMFDSRWTIPVAISLLERGDTNLDEYGALIEEDKHYAVECVHSDGTLELGGMCPDGHSYTWYPVAVPIIASPFVLVLRKSPDWVLDSLARRAPPPVRAALLARDFIASRTTVEILIASVLVALTAVLMFLIGRLFLPDPYAAFLAMIFAFGTSAWSTASRAMWQHGPSMLMISLAIYILLLAQRKPWLVALAAIPVAFAYMLRPTNSLFAVIMTIYVARHYRKYLSLYLLAALPIATGFLIYNEAMYHRLLPSYFSMRPALLMLPQDTIPIFQALTGVLVSPSRGLLIYSPIFLFSIWGMIWARRTGWNGRLSTYLISVVIGNWLLICLYFRFWWGGHSYGPRLLSDLTPILILFLIPSLMRWRESPGRLLRPAPLAFVGLLSISVFIHSRGALSIDVYRWNSEPVNVDQKPDRLWDLRDPQFLRGLLW